MFLCFIPGLWSRRIRKYKIQIWLDFMAYSLLQSKYFKYQSLHWMEFINIIWTVWSSLMFVLILNAQEILFFCSLPETIVGHGIFAKFFYGKVDKFNFSFTKNLKNSETKSTWNSTQEATAKVQLGTEMHVLWLEKDSKLNKS